MKNQYRLGDCLKRGAWADCKFKGGLGKKEGVVFMRGSCDPNPHYAYAYITCAYLHKRHQKTLLVLPTKIY